MQLIEDGYRDQVLDYVSCMLAQQVILGQTCEPAATVVAASQAKCMSKLDTLEMAMIAKRGPLNASQIRSEVDRFEAQFAKSSLGTVIRVRIKRSECLGR